MKDTGLEAWTQTGSNSHSSAKFGGERMKTVAGVRGHTRIHTDTHSKAAMSAVILKTKVDEVTTECHIYPHANFHDDRSVGLAVKHGHTRIHTDTHSDHVGGHFEKSSQSHF